MRYPSPEDYLKAVQRTESFTTDELRRCALVPHPLYGIPMPAAGTSAVVFKAVVDGEPQALRFFTREDRWSADRYDALHEHFASSDLAGVVAMPSWVHDGITVNGRTWPVVRMQWVDGHPLNKHVDDLVRAHDSRGLGALADAWLDLVVRLQRTEFAHGDLQHGNVLVDDRGAMRLVDFDCSWITRFSGWPAPSETGHRNYQPETRPWGRWMDTFSGLVIYTSLLALSKNPNPWHVLNNGENLLFRREDFRPPFDTAAWEHLSSIGDRQLDQLAARIAECCAPGWVAAGSLGDLVAPRPLQWWERTQAGAARPVPAPNMPPMRPVGPVLRQPAGHGPADRAPVEHGTVGHGTVGHGPADRAPAGHGPAGHGTVGRAPVARAPGANWWQESRPRRRMPVGWILAAALVLGVIAGGLSSMALVGLFVAMVTAGAGFIGFAARR
jgi:eukaryotic-like serine/threonine-protein kinase